MNGRRITVSISDSPDLEILGFEQAHLGLLRVALMRHLLALGVEVAYGGDQRKRGYSNIPFDLVRAYAYAYAYAYGYADDGRIFDERMVHWYIACQIHVNLDNSKRAELPDVIEVHAIGQPEDAD